MIGIRVRRMVLVAGALGLTIATGTFAGASAAAISGGVAGGRGACAGRAPRQLSVTRDGPTQVRVRWHAPLHGHPSAYRLLRSGATVGQTSTLAMVAALAVHTRATFAVQARYANGRACAAKVAMQMRYQLPGRVSHLRVLRSASSSLTIAWRRARAGQAPLAGYRVKRDGAVVGQTRHTTLKLSVDLQTRHTIVVYAVDSAGHLGPRSAALHVGAAKGTAGLRPPTQLAVSSVSDESATVSWLPGKSRGTPIVGYRVYRNGDAVGQTAKTSMTLTHLSSRQTYSITVTSVDGAGAQSAPSGALKLTTTHRSPAPPSLLAAQSVSDTSVTLTWSPGSASSGTLAGYLVYENGQAEKSVSAQDVSLAVASERKYTFAVRSRDSAGYLSAPTPDLQVTSTHTGPSVPGALSASNVTSDSASVSWSASTPVSGRIVGYVVYKNGIPVGQTTSLTESLVNLAPETTYDVSVAAVDSLGATSAQAPAIDVQTGVPVQSTGAVQAFLLATTSQSFQDFEARYQQIGTVYPTYFDCTPQAAITGNNDPLVTDWAQERGVAVMPRINCQDPTVVNEILTDPTITQQTIATLASLAQSNGYQGLMIDFESNLPSDRSAFTAFITALAAQLHAQGEKLATVVTAKTYNIQSGRAAIYDDAALSVPSDWVFVLDWGLHWTTSGPGAMDDLPWSTQVADYVASMPNKGKFVLGLPLYGIDWPAGSGASNPGTPLQYADVVALEAQYGITPSWDPVAQAPYFNYTDASGVAHTVYYTDAQSVQARVALAQSLGLNVGFWRLGTEDPGVWGLPGLGS